MNLTKLERKLVIIAIKRERYRRKYKKLDDKYNELYSENEEFFESQKKKRREGKLNN